MKAILFLLCCGQSGHKNTDILLPLYFFYGHIVRIYQLTPYFFSQYILTFSLQLFSCYHPLFPDIIQKLYLYCFLPWTGDTHPPFLWKRRFQDLETRVESCTCQKLSELRKENGNRDTEKKQTMKMEKVKQKFIYILCVTHACLGNVMFPAPLFQAEFSSLL